MAGVHRRGEEGLRGEVYLQALAVGAGAARPRGSQLRPVARRLLAGIDHEASICLVKDERGIADGRGFPSRESRTGKEQLSVT